MSNTEPREAHAVMSLSEKIEKSIREVASEAGVLLPQDLDKDGYFQEEGLQAFFSDNDASLVYIFKKYCMESKKLVSVLSFEEHILSLDASDMSLPYHSFFKAACDLGIYPQLDNSLRSNFQLMRIFLHVATQAIRKERHSDANNGSSDEAKRRAVTEAFMGLPWMRGGDLANLGGRRMSTMNSMSRSSLLDDDSSYQSSAHGMSSRGSKNFPKHGRAGKQNEDGGGQASSKDSQKCSNFEEHLKKVSGLLSDILKDRKIPIHDSNQADIRQILNSVGENPLPGELQFFMKFLREIRGRPRDDKYSRSFNGKKAVRQQPASAAVSAAQFIEGWKKAASLAHKVATREVTYENFKVCIGTCLFFIYNGKFKGGDGDNLAKLADLLASNAIEKVSSGVCDEATEADMKNGMPPSNNDNVGNDNNKASFGLHEMFSYALHDLISAHQVSDRTGFPPQICFCFINRFSSCRFKRWLIHAPFLSFPFLSFPFLSFPLPPFPSK